MSEIKNTLAPLDVSAGRGTRKLGRQGTGSLEPNGDGTDPRPDGAPAPNVAATASQTASSLSLDDTAGGTGTGSWAGGSAFAMQLAQEAMGPAAESGMSDFRKQVAQEEARRAQGSNGGGTVQAEPVSDFRRQMEIETEKDDESGGVAEISAFRRQMLEDDKRLAGPGKIGATPTGPDKALVVDKPAVDRPALVDKPAVDRPALVDKPAVDGPAQVDKPTADEPALVDEPVTDRPAPIEKPVDQTTRIALPGEHRGDKLAAVRAALGDDSQALADLDTLAAQGLLGQVDPQGALTLLDHLDTIASQPIPMGSAERRALLAGTLADLVRPDSISRPSSPATDSVIGTAQARLAAQNPAEYARLVAGLSSETGKTNLDVSGTIARPPEWQPGTGAGSAATQLLRDSFASKVDASKADNYFAKRFDSVLAAVQNDPAAMAGLGNLLLEGSLGNPDVRGQSVLERLADLANTEKPINAKWNGALDDRGSLVRSLVKAIAPAPQGPDDLSDPRRLWARTATAEYIRVASETATMGRTSILPETHFAITWTAEQIEAKRAAKTPPASAPDYLASMEWMETVMPPEMASPVDRLKRAMAGDPKAQTALELIALKGQFYWAGSGIKTAIRIEDVERMAAAAEGKVHLAPGIDPKDFVSSLLKDLATPSRAIVQGNSQTCTVTSLQRIMAEESPSEYSRIMFDLASPEGKTALARGQGVQLSRPADWNAAAGTDQRDAASRLFQSTFMHRAVETINQEAYQSTGFPAGSAQADTYDTATDTWTDALGRERRGLPPEALNGLLGDVENERKIHIDVPPSVRDIIGQPDFPAAQLLQTAFSFLDSRQKETKVWRVPVTLALTYPDGEQQLHEVLLSSVASGPPPTATILDPIDGHSKQIDLVAFGKSIRSISLPDDAAEQTQKFLPSMGAALGVSALLLGQMGKYSTNAITSVAPLLLQWLSGGSLGNQVGNKPSLPALPPPGSPDPAELASLTAALPPADTPARFALDTLVRSGQLDQRTLAGRALLANLQNLARTRQEDLAPGVDKAKLLSGVIREVANADPLVAPVSGDTTAAASAQRLLAATRPGEYVRLITDLAGRDGTARLDGGNGPVVRLPEDWQEATADSTVELADRLLQPALDQYARLRIAEAAGAPAGTMATGPLGSWAVADMVDGLFGQNNPRVRLPDNATESDRAGFVSRIGQQADLGKPVPVTLAAPDGEGRPVFEELVVMGFEDDPTGHFVTLLDPSDGTPKRMALADFSATVQAARMPPQDADPAADVSFGLGSYLDDDAGWGKSRFNTADAGWSRGRFVQADAGWGKGRFTGEDAGWGRSRMVSGDAGWGRGRFTGEDAGWGRSRFVSGDAGWGRSRLFGGDAGGGGNGVVGEDAGWGRSRLVASDAGWGKSRFVAADAGWGKGRFVRGDAGSGGQTFQEEIG